MKLPLFTVLLLALSSAGCSHQPIYGKYRECYMVCEEIDLRPDGTFTYRNWGDLCGGYDANPDRGTWHFEDSRQRLIWAEGSTKQPESSVRTLPASGERLIVHVVDDSRTSLPAARVVISCGTNLQAKVTDLTGTVELQRCAVDHVEVELPGFISFDQDMSVSGDLEVRLPARVGCGHAGTGSWLVSGGRLYRLEAQPLPRMRDSVRPAVEPTLHP
jgi:hypothetical protein